MVYDNSYGSAVQVDSQELLEPQTYVYDPEKVLIHHRHKHPSSPSHSLTRFSGGASLPPTRTSLWSS